MSGNSARSSAAHLRAWGRDYDGSPMAEDAEPRPGLTVGHLYDAAALIEELESALQKMTQNARGLIVSLRHGCLMPGDFARQADQIRAVEADISAAEQARIVRSSRDD